MKGSEAIVEMLSKYHVKHVFGLIGETTFPLYEAWNSNAAVAHVFGRDERNLAIMAEAYGRVSGKPGVLEVPGVGASYILPGIIEAYSSGTPLIAISSDISTDSTKKNFLTEYDKELMFRGVVREYIDIQNGKDIPRLFRRAFRVANSLPTGPVFVRVPLNAYSDVVEPDDLYSQEQFSSYPAFRQQCEPSLIADAASYLSKAVRPVIICGQGVLYSDASADITDFAKHFGIPVGTTISGKGSFPETDPLSIGVVGSRGGSSFSEEIINSSDLIFFVGTNTDSASTSTWKVPPKSGSAMKIQLDADSKQLGNNYKTDLCLLGDVKSVISALSECMKEKGVKKIGRKKSIMDGKTAWQTRIDSLPRDESPVDPISFVHLLSEKMNRFGIITADPGVAAIYSAAYMKCAEPGRRFLYNYSIGGLGFALPASIGAYFATGKTTVCLTTDGSLAFNQGELETVAREKVKVKIFVFNNSSFGWIRATMLSEYGKVLDGTDIHQIKYDHIAKAYGLDYFNIEKTSGLRDDFSKIFADDSPCLVNVNVLPEDRLLPPVPEWKHSALNGKVRYLG